MSVIVDTPCFYKECLDNVERISNETGAVFKYIECFIPDYSIIQKRIKTRVRPTNIEWLQLDTSSESTYNFNEVKEHLRT